MLNNVSYHIINNGVYYINNHSTAKMEVGHDAHLQVLKGEVS